MSRRFVCAMIGAAFVMLALCLVALARDDGRYANTDPEVKAWVRGLKNKSGEGCCDTADGYPAEAQYDTAHGRYRVFIEGEWYFVSDNALLTGPNRLGYAVVWYWRENGRPKIRCFIPGSGI